MQCIEKLVNGKQEYLGNRRQRIKYEACRGLLPMGKYTILEAFDAESGIQMAREHHSDLILMDIQLPGMDGLNATRNILSDADLKHIPIVALTSYAMQGDKEKTLAAGCAGYITKPIHSKCFLNVISEYLDTD